MVADKLAAADAVRDMSGFAIKLYAPEGHWDLAGNNGNNSEKSL